MEQKDIFERIGSFFRGNPKYFGILLVIFGVFVLVAAIKNWEWVLRGSSPSLKHKQITSHHLLFRAHPRLFTGIGGIVCAGIGIMWLLIRKWV